MSWGANIANEVLGHTERELEAARSTIAELQKRIGELDQEANELSDMARQRRLRIVELEQALTAERQRREEVRELLQKGIIGNEAGPEMRPRLVVYFERVEDAYKLADFLISIKDAPSESAPPSSTEAENE